MYLSLSLSSLSKLLNGLKETGRICAIHQDHEWRTLSLSLSLSHSARAIHNLSRVNISPAALSAIIVILYSEALASFPALRCQKKLLHPLLAWCAELYGTLTVANTKGYYCFYCSSYACIPRETQQAWRCTHIYAITYAQLLSQCARNRDSERERERWRK